MSMQLAFHEHHFNVIERSSQIWLTSSDLAAALQYKNEKSITNLFNKNFDEFTPGMSEVIESVTSKNAETLNLSVSGNLKVRQRIFSLRGAHLIAMFARTPVAKEFRRWVLDILDRETGLFPEESAKAKTRQCTAKQLTPLRQTVERLITIGVGNIYPDIWKLVHQRFDVEHIHQLQPDQVGEAIEYLNVLEGEYLGKQPHLPAISFNNDYSMGFFKGYLWMIGEKSIRTPWSYPAELLSPNGDYPNPCGKLLFELKHQGYSVEAAQFHLMALQHHLEVYRSKIEEIQREIGGLGYR